MDTGSEQNEGPSYNDIAMMGMNAEQAEARRTEMLTKIAAIEFDLSKAEKDLELFRSQQSAGTLKNPELLTDQMRDVDALKQRLTEAETQYQGLDKI